MGSLAVTINKTPPKPMAKLEILGIKKPPAPPETPPEPKKAKAKGKEKPETKAEPKPEAKAKAKGKGKKWVKRDRPTRENPHTLADGSPMYVAVGVIQGILDIQKRAIIGTDGYSYPIAGLKDQKLLWWLLENADDWRSQPIPWLVWPRLGYYTIVGRGTRPDLPPWTFKIQGSLCPPKADQNPDYFGIWVGRNTGEGGWTIHEIIGSIPDARDRSLYRCNCTMNKGSLILDTVESVKPKVATRDPLVTEENGLSVE